MEYDCQLLSISSLTTTFNRVVKPICSNCKNTNCSNPIQEKKISIFGKVYSTKVYNMGNGFFIVSECEGFIEDSEKFDDI